MAIRRRSPERALGTGGTINWGIFKRHFWGELLRHQQVLCRIERRPPRLDMTVYPYLPQAHVAMTSAKTYLALLTGAAS